MSEISQKDIDFLFQEEVLDQHGEFLQDLFMETIEQKNIRVSDDLLESLDANYKIFKEGTDRGLRYKFNIYGRFIEIRKHKKKNKIEPNTNALLWGVKENRPKKRKDVDWYSANAYGSLNRLYSILSNELTTEEVSRLKGIIQNRINTQK